MENTYSGIFKNKHHIPTEIKSFESLKDISKDTNSHHLKLYTDEDIASAFIYDLKLVLAKEELEELLQEFFTLENNLIHLDSILSDKVKVPKLEDFYRNLSPSILRSMWEYCMNPESTDVVIHSWIEAIRIALEEEFYSWQEKIMS